MDSLSEYWSPKPGNEVVLREKADRLAFKEAGTSWVYGEITEEGIQTMLLGVPHEGTFVDLGSGRGLIPAYVQLNYGYQQCVGVELSQTRWEISQRNKQQASGKHNLTGVQYLNQDLFEYDLSDADTIFTNNLAFGLQANSRLFSKVGKEAKIGSHFITVLRVSDNSICPRLRLKRGEYVQTTWMERCPVFIYEVCPH